MKVYVTTHDIRWFNEGESPYLPKLFVYADWYSYVDGPPFRSISSTLQEMQERTSGRTYFHRTCIYFGVGSWGISIEITRKPFRYIPEEKQVESKYSKKTKIIFHRKYLNGSSFKQRA